MSTAIAFYIGKKISLKEALLGTEWFTWGLRVEAFRLEEDGWKKRALRSGSQVYAASCPWLTEGDDIRVVYFAEEVEAVPAPAQEDLVSRPAHYARFKVEPITFIMENDLPFEIGSAVKYVVRAGHKIYEGMSALESELTDLGKAKRMIEMRIGKLKGEPVY